MDAALNSAPILVLILVADLAITFLHSWQELKGAGAPLWRNFGAIVGLDISDRWGFLLFTVALTVTISAIGIVGILGLLGPGCSAFALGMLIGARLSDTFVSHVLLYGVGYRPNPGLSSTPLYVLEALFIVWAFHARLAVDPGFAKWGFIVGRRHVPVGAVGIAAAAIVVAHAGAARMGALATDAVMGIRESIIRVSDRCRGLERGGRKASIFTRERLPRGSLFRNRSAAPIRPLA